MKDFLLINKPEGWTSFDVVAKVRGLLRKNDPEKMNIKVGHAGTLDPFATGLLIVGIGREATKRLDEFKNLPKTYVATIHLGATATTDDKTGELTPVSGRVPEITEIKNILANFVGKQNQIPPMYSAKKVGGKRLYKIARKGETVEREPSEIEIYSLTLLEYSYPLLKIEVSCSAGTYIRTLARDIGEKLGVGAYCKELCRTKIGSYDLTLAKTISKTSTGELLTGSSDDGLK